ncbi:MAG TPA: hypothetical protein VGC56_15210 [Allosphingosinicella sp.]|jgi:CRP-like cAMP-binding protein
MERLCAVYISRDGLKVIERFKGEHGRRLLLETLRSHHVLGGVDALIEMVADRGELLPIAAGESFIEQASDANDVFLIVSGTCDVAVNGRKIAVRGAGDLVGEMADGRAAAGAGPRGNGDRRRADGASAA